MDQACDFVAPDPRRAPHIEPQQRPRETQTDLIDLHAEDIPLTEAYKMINGYWDDYADALFRALHCMVAQTEHLQFSNDEYTGLVWSFTRFIRRPSVSTLLTPGTEMTSECTSLHSVWNRWADRAIEIYLDMAHTMSRCNLLPEGSRPIEDRGISGLDLSQLSLSHNQPQAHDLPALLHKMLDDANSYDEESAHGTTGLEPTMERLNL